MIHWFKKRPTPLSLAEQLEHKLTTPKRKSVLFVDDDMALQDLMHQMERRMKIEVTGASTASSAKVMIMSRSFDLAILDIAIMNGDGLKLYQWIQDNFPKMSVIFLTGGSLDEICPKVHAIGSAPVYFKPSANTLTFLADLLRYCGATPA